MKFDFVDKYAMATLSVQEDGPLALQWKKKKKSLGGHDLWLMEGVGAAIVGRVVLSICTYVKFVPCNHVVGDCWFLAIVVSAFGSWLLQIVVC